METRGRMRTVRVGAIQEPGGKWSAVLIEVNGAAQHLPGYATAEAARRAAIAIVHSDGASVVPMAA